MTRAVTVTSGPEASTANGSLVLWYFAVASAFQRVMAGLPRCSRGSSITTALSLKHRATALASDVSAAK